MPAQWRLELSALRWACLPRQPRLPDAQQGRGAHSRRCSSLGRRPLCRWRGAGAAGHDQQSCQNEVAWRASCGSYGGQRLFSYGGSAANARPLCSSAAPEQAPTPRFLLPSPAALGSPCSPCSCPLPACSLLPCSLPAPQEKNIQHSGNISIEDIYEVARVMADRSCAATFAGTVKEMLGTAVSGGWGGWGVWGWAVSAWVEG